MTETDSPGGMLDIDVSGYTQRLKQRIGTAAEADTAYTPIQDQELLHFEPEELSRFTPQALQRHAENLAMASSVEARVVLPLVLDRFLAAVHAPRGMELARNDTVHTETEAVSGSQTLPDYVLVTALVELVRGLGETGELSQLPEELLAQLARLPSERSWQAVSTGLNVLPELVAMDMQRRPEQRQGYLEQAEIRMLTLAQQLLMSTIPGLKNS